MDDNDESIPRLPDNQELARPVRLYHIELKDVLVPQENPDILLVYERQQQQQIHAEQLRQAKWSFNVVVGLGSLGILLLLIGLFVGFVNFSMGVFSAVVGAILDLFAGLVHVKNGADDKLQMRQEFMEFLRLVQGCSDEVERNRMISEYRQRSQANGRTVVPKAKKDKKVPKT